MTELRRQMTQDLQLAGLSEGTQRAYLRALQELAKFFNASPDLLTEKQVREYFLYLKNDRKFAPGSLKIAYNGIKFFYTYTVPRQWPTLRRVRVGKGFFVPDILTVEQVHQVIAAVRSRHRRTFLWTVYSCGLRLTEARHLRIDDIDAKRMRIHVHRGKGVKDRFVPLPSSTLKMLRHYWSTHRNPVLLFPSTRKSATTQKVVAVSGIRACLKQVLSQLGIRKRIYIHSLRHCYATHLLDAGVNLWHIQRYLGHASIRSTSIYLHLTTAGQQQAREIIEKLMQEPANV